MGFHTVPLDPNRPFADFKPQPKLTKFPIDDAATTMAIKSSTKLLRGIIYTHRATSQSAYYSIIWQRGVLYRTNHILHAFE